MVAASPIAYLMLILVVPASIAAFALLKPTRAVLAILFGSLLFLPEVVNFDAPLIPPLSKESIPALTCLIGVFIVARERMRKAQLGRGVDVLMIIGLLGTIPTVYLNPDPVRYGPILMPGLTSSDVITAFVTAGLGPYARFLLGRALFRTAEDAKDLLRAFVIGAAIYWPFMLFEIRMSPQLHSMIYGFFPGEFAQVLRFGGYRPQVFMAHGLLLAIFVWASVIAAWTLRNAKAKLFGLGMGAIAVISTLMFPLIKSVAAIIYTLVVVPVQWLLKPKAQIRLAAFIGCVVLAYPLMRASGTFPREAIIDYATSFTDADRAQSLDFRFHHEELLLTHALEKPVFGWGYWGRNRIFDEEGEDLSVTDGEWILVMGINGILGFVVHFGLLVVPIFMALRSVDKVAPADRPILAGVALIAAVNALDLVPNSSFGAHLGMLLSGATAGLAQGLPTEARSRLDPRLVARWLAALKRAGLVPAVRS